jgi:hypothetical protein
MAFFDQDRYIAIRMHQELARGRLSPKKQESAEQADSIWEIWMLYIR